MLLWKVITLLLLSILLVFAKENWIRPGCHKVGNTRKIAIPECVEFHITTNACRGFCESYAVPSAAWSSAAVSSFFKPTKPVISVGQCCNMMESEESIYNLLFGFLSASADPFLSASDVGGGPKIFFICSKASSMDFEKRTAQVSLFECQAPTPKKMSSSRGL
ncbi:hypothetical protein GQX74_001071 [Glossina fuscipes]|nr:hypothetical protein GQX74_001071 [Glossina fuscipes]